MLAIQGIEKTLLALPAEQPVLLAESLLDSLPPAGEVWSETEDLVEVERRERQIESGEEKPGRNFYRRSQRKQSSEMMGTFITRRWGFLTRLPGGVGLVAANPVAFDALSAIDSVSGERL